MQTSSTQAQEGASAIRQLFAQAGRPGAELEAMLPKALSAIRTHLGMEVSFLSEFARGRRVFRVVDSSWDGCPVTPGGSDPLEESYCQRVVDGRLPGLLPDAAVHPVSRALPVTAAVPVGAHLSVPVRFTDGQVFGTFCCFSTVPNHSLNERDLAMMRVFADWIAEAMENERARSRHRDAARERIEQVLAGDSLSPVYQAICRLSSRSVSGFECLSRFSAPPKRSPDQWFAEAAGVGLGAELELKAIETGLQGLARLPGEAYLSVNASPALLADARLHALLARVPAARVVLELTEHETIAEYGELLAALRALRERGVRVAVDDAGAGYASFRHILEIMPAFIKLDTSLTRAIDKDPARRALGTAMVRFCRETGSALVAEGIETRAELEALRELGVELGQGYFLQRPQPIEEAAALAAVAA